MSLRQSFSSRSAGSRWNWIGLKKISVAPIEKKKAFVEVGNPMIPIARQCELLRVSRSSLYYDSQRDDGYNLMLMNRIDEHYENAVLRRAEDDGLTGGRGIYGQS